MIVSAPLANNINPYMSYPREIFTDILSEFGLLPVLTMIYQQTESAGWKSKNKRRDFEVKIRFRLTKRTINTEDMTSRSHQSSDDFSPDVKKLSS